MDLRREKKQILNDRLDTLDLDAADPDAEAEDGERIATTPLTQADVKQLRRAAKETWKEIERLRGELASMREQVKEVAGIKPKVDLEVQKLREGHAELTAKHTEVRINHERRHISDIHRFLRMNRCDNVMRTSPLKCSETTAY